MRIVIEIDDEKVVALRTEGGPTQGPAPSGDEATALVASLPPLELLERARQLGALSAGGAQFGRGAALAATAPAGETPTVERKAAQRKSRRRRK